MPNGTHYATLQQDSQHHHPFAPLSKRPMGAASGMLCGRHQWSHWRHWWRVVVGGRCRWLVLKKRRHSGTCLCPVTILLRAWIRCLLSDGKHHQQVVLMGWAGVLLAAAEVSVWLKLGDGKMIQKHGLTKRMSSNSDWPWIDVITHRTLITKEVSLKRWKGYQYHIIYEMQQKQWSY